MRFLRYMCTSLLLIALCTTTKISPLKKNSAASEFNKKYVILFELTNVLVKENQMGFSKKVGYGNLASYTLTHWKNPGHRCLDMLEAISKHEKQIPHITVTLNKKILPRCLVELQEGKKTSAQTSAEIREAIEVLDTQNYFTSIKEKNLMHTIMKIALDPQFTATLIEPIKPTVQLAHKLKAAGHSIYIFANTPDELFKAFQKKHPEIISIFDGVVVSSDVKAVKPDPIIFDHLIRTHNVNPKDCILIDDRKENLTAAKNRGMQVVAYDKSSSVMSKLKKCGVRL
jgi:HAD superfamily hydrolase (TIGR01509 family)